MEDAESNTDKKNCTFLFKRRKIRSTAARKRKTANDGNGKYNRGTSDFSSNVPMDCNFII